MDQLNPREQQEFQQLVERKQMKDFMRVSNNKIPCLQPMHCLSNFKNILKLYSSLVQRCFTDCVNDFTSNTLSYKEETCINRCSEKFLKHSERVGQRFQEQK